MGCLAYILKPFHTWYRNNTHHRKMSPANMTDTKNLVAGHTEKETGGVGGRVYWRDLRALEIQVLEPDLGPTKTLKLSFCV